MKFTRRHDLDPHTRIEIVKHVWIHQSIYGKMTQIAQEYHISRTFLYQLSWTAKHHLEDLFSDPQHLVEPPDVLLEPWILCCAWKANARFRASRRSSSTSTTSPTPWAISVNTSETMGAASVHALNAPQESGVLSQR